MSNSYQSPERKESGDQPEIESHLETDKTLFENPASTTSKAIETSGDVEQKSIQGFIGRVIDERYRIVSLLGEGGMGAVFIAEHLKLHKRFALKVVRAELAGNGEVAVRFAREAMATAQFEHPNVANAVDYGTLPEGGAYFVMQLIRGKSLAQILEKRKHLPWNQVCKLGVQIADALSAAEEAGIVHRDLKPENILIETRKDGSELVRILDFGIAHVPKTDAPAPEGAMVTRELTKLGAVMGTPGYMAPEQTVGELTDHRTDLYALGVVLWESIVGRPLWEATEVTTLFTRQLSEPVASMKRTAGDPTIPNSLERLVMKLLERSPSDRPAHSIEVRDKLKEISQQYIPINKTLLNYVQKFLLFISLTIDTLYRWFLLWNRQTNSRKHIQLVAGLTGLVILIAITVGTAEKKSTPVENKDTTAKEEAAEPSQIITNVAKVIVETVTPKEPSIPAEIENDVNAMNDGKRVRERRAAAKIVLEYEPKTAVPAYIIDIAALEAARGCASRRDAIAKIRQAGDKRTLKALRRLSRMPKTGCGFLGLEDCYSCIRSALRETIEEIESKENDM